MSERGVGARLRWLALFALWSALSSIVSPPLAAAPTSDAAEPEHTAVTTDLDAPAPAANNLPDVTIEAPRVAPEETPPSSPSNKPPASSPGTTTRAPAPDSPAANEASPVDPAANNAGEGPDRIDPGLLLDQSISTFDEAEIRRQDIGLLNDLRGRVPNLNASDNNLRGFNNVYNLRGLGNTQFFSNPAVVTYVDGVPLGNAFAYASDFYDLESIEVYRGPQPALFGRNSSAGVINVRTVKPGDRYRGNATITYGSFNTQEYVGNVSGPVAPGVAYLGVGGYATTSDGYVYNSAFGRELDDRDGIGGRAQLRLTPTDNWDILLFADLDQYTDGDGGLTPLTGPRYVQSNAKEGRTRISRNTLALRAEGQFDWGTVTSATARQWFDLSPNFTDISPYVSLPFGTLESATTTQEQQQEQYTTELRVASPRDNDGPVRWQAGFFYLTGETKADGTNEFIATFPFFPPPPSSFTVNNTSRTTFQLEEENVALFGEVGVDLSKTVELLLGLRLDYTRKKLVNRQRVLVPTGALQAAPLNLNHGEFNPAPSIGLAWTPTPQSRVFWNTTYGFQSGGFVGFADTAQLATFDTQRILANEIGTEWRSPDGKLRLGATGFFYKIWDYQVERTTVPPQFLILNAPESRSLGAEVSASYEPLPGLVLAGAFGYTNFEFERYTDPFTGQDYAGNTAPFVPEFNATASAQYRHESGAFARVEMLAFGETYYDEANSDRFRQGSYVLLNAKVGWENEHAGVYFTGKNLTDAFYFTNITPDLAAGVPGPPQYVGVEVTGKF